jgi:hypothetical protein
MKRLFIAFEEDQKTEIPLIEKENRDRTRSKRTTASFE